MKTETREKAWREIRPGHYARSIPKDKRRVNRDFVEAVADQADSPALRSLILKTGAEQRKTDKKSGK